MTTPSQPTDLDKALERVNKRLDAGERVYRGDIEPIMRAAKRSKELEKERDELKAQRILDDGNITRMQDAGARAEVELSTLRAAYNQALEALGQLFPGGLSLHEYLFTQYPATQGNILLRDFCIQQDAAISTSLAIETMKGKV